MERRTGTHRIGTSASERLWAKFKEFWPPWAEHVDHYEERDDKSITVYFKEDKYITSGSVYIFGDKGDENWFLNRIQGPKK